MRAPAATARCSCAHSARTRRPVVGAGSYLLERGWPDDQQFKNGIRPISVVPAGLHAGSAGNAGASRGHKEPADLARDASRARDAADAEPEWSRGLGPRPNASKPTPSPPGKPDPQCLQPGAVEPPLLEEAPALRRQQHCDYPRVGRIRYMGRSERSSSAAGNLPTKPQPSGVDRRSPSLRRPVTDDDAGDRWTPRAPPTSSGPD